MKRTLLILSTFSILLSCSSDSTETPVTEAQEEVAVIDANRILTLDVAGMACEMACGGSIRDALTETGAVASVDYDFKMGRDVNTAIIKFDDSKLNAKEIQEKIEAINDGQFTVTNPSEASIESNTIVEESSKSSGTSDVNVDYSAGVEIPNLLEILADMLTN